MVVKVAKYHTNRANHNILLWLVSTAWLKLLNAKKLFSYTSSKKIGLQGRPHAVLINIMIQSAHLGFCFLARFGRTGIILCDHHWPAYWPSHRLANHL